MWARKPKPKPKSEEPSTEELLMTLMDDPASTDNQQGIQLSPESDLMDLNADEADEVAESDEESQDGSSFSTTAAEVTKEADKAILKEHTRKQASNERHVTSSDNAESDSIINRARDYQQELFERAMDENVIAVLDTGSGKTLIAALLIRHFLEQELFDRNNGKPHKIVFFLVNSVHLARQQTRFLNNNLPHNAMALFGETNEDLWKKAQWEDIFVKNRVIVCTAAILDQCLMHSFLTIGQISLLIFDEAHHCKKSHPYAIIIRDYYLKWKGEKPRIFGMTASPVDSKRDISRVTSELEELLQSKIITTKDASVFEFAPRARDIRWTYSPMRMEFDTELTHSLRPLCGFIEDLQKYFTFSKYAARQLGTWAADRVWKYAIPVTDHGATAVIRKFEQSKVYNEDSDSDRRRAKLAKAQQAFSLVRGHYFGPPRFDVDREVSPKVKCLFTELERRFAESKATRAIVFVAQRITAYILCDLFESSAIPNLRPGVLVGVHPQSIESSHWRDQATVMDQFRSGIINVMFSTSVAEEGIDIPQCNLVVRFDLYDTPIQYMQSRGRARMKNSEYAHMIEKGNQSHVSTVNYAIEMDEYIRLFCQSLPPDRLLGSGTKLKQLMAKDASCPRFKTPTGAVASHTNSLLLLSRYVDSLERVEARSREIYEEIIDAEKNTFQYKVILPTTNDPRAAQVKGALGDHKANKVMARRSAAWRCCVKLRKAELLDTNLDSVFGKVKPHNHNARLAVDERKEIYPKKLKPDFWRDSGVGTESLPAKLFVTRVAVGTLSTSTATNSLLLFTRAPLPTIPKFPVFVDENVEKSIFFDRMQEPVQINERQIQALTDFTVNAVLKDLFQKTFASDPNFMSYWLAPPACTPLGSSFETFVNMDELLLAGHTQRRRWIPATSPDDGLKQAAEWCQAFLVDPGSGKFRYFTRNIDHAKTIWDVPPEPSIRLGKKFKNSIIAFSDSTYGKRRKDAALCATRYDPYQPVIKAKVVLAGRNFLQKYGPGEQRFDECDIAPQPLNIGRISVDTAAFGQMWPSILHRLESYLIVREPYLKLGLPEVPLDLALESFTMENSAITDITTAGEPGVDESDALPKKAPLNYERLEFIGDSLLKMMTTIAVFIHTTCNEEGMHCKRMEMLANRRLCSTASKPEYELFQYIRAASEPHWATTWYPEFIEQIPDRAERRIVVKSGFKSHPLGMKTIADVCEAMIGACIMTSQNLPVEEKLDLGIRAITKLVDDPYHDFQSWRDVRALYKRPTWCLQMNDPVADDLATTVEQITGYKFKYPRLLRSAFTHSSDQNSTVPDLQRMEFLGDACLDWVSIWWLFSKNATRGPQWLTEHKMAMVSNRFLSALAVVLGFHKLIYAESMKVYEDIGRYSAMVQEKYEQGPVERDFWTRLDPGSSPPKALADLVESYLGAVLLDSNFNLREIEIFFEKHVKWFFENIETYDSFAKLHPTTHLLKLLIHRFQCHDNSSTTIEETTTTTTRGDHDEDDDDEGAGDQSIGGITAHVAWIVHGRVVATGKGHGVGYAKLKASRVALKILSKLSVDEFRRKWGWIPASFCGLYSLKPSYGRFPTCGLRDGLAGQEAVRNAIGPLATSLASVEMWTKAVLESEPWTGADPDCLPIPWRDIVVPEKLCFGRSHSQTSQGLLGNVKPLPPVTRALLQTKAALEAAGHTVFDFHIDEPLYTESLKFALYRSAAAEQLGTTLAKTQEPWPRGFGMFEAMATKSVKINGKGQWMRC
ncbi:Dicer-like protein 1 [Exophiala oligosperma]